MRPTLPRFSGGGNEPLDTKHGQFIGTWGNMGSQKQRGIISYAISANRQRPLAGTAHAAVFNVWRRFRAQVLYVVPPLLVGYAAIQWATEKNHYYNSKEGRMAESEETLKASVDGGSVRG